MNDTSSDELRRSIPSVKLSLVLYVLTILLGNTAGVVAFVICGVDFQYLVILEIAVQWGSIFLPVVLVVWLWRFDYRKTLNLNSPTLQALFGTILVAPSSCVIVHEMLSWQMRVVSMPEELNAMVNVIRDYGQTKAGLAILLAMAAFSAPVCEELLYRGVLVSSLRRRLKPVPITIVVGLLFALYHLHPYRIVLIFPFGILLTYVVVRSGSIYLSMLFHSIFNSLSLGLILGFDDRLPPAIRYSDEHGFSTIVLAASLLLFIIGVVLIERDSRGRTSG